VHKTTSKNAVFTPSGIRPHDETQKVFKKKVKLIEATLSVVQSSTRKPSLFAVRLPSGSLFENGISKTKSHRGKRSCEKKTEWFL